MATKKAVKKVAKTKTPKDLDTATKYEIVSAFELLSEADHDDPVLFVVSETDVKSAKKLIKLGYLQKNRGVGSYGSDSYTRTELGNKFLKNLFKAKR